MRTFTKVWIGIALMAFGFGIAILGIAFVIGNNTGRTPFEETSFQESYKDVESIDLQVCYGKVIVKKGDTFSIEATHVVKGSIKSYVENGTWYIEEDPYNNRNLFGFNISLGNIGFWNRDYNPTIVVTVPESFEAENFDIDVDAGDVQIESMISKNGTISVGAGRLNVDHIKIDNSSSYRVDAGKMTLNDVELKDISLDCGVGQININGVVTGDSDLSCDVGKIELSLEGSSKDYSYDISTDIGKVMIDGRSYYNEITTIDNGTGNSLNLTCGVGKITVDFQ